MGAFRSSIPRLLWLYLVAACFLFALPRTGFQVSAEENDADLVFENNLEESKLVSDDNKHTIERRDTSHQTNHLNSKSSQPIEDEHWLTTAVKRLKRQWNIGSWFAEPEEDEEKTEDSRERRASGEEGQVGQQTDDDFDNNIEDNDDEDVVEDLIPESHKHQDLQGAFGGGDDQTDDEDDFGDLSGEGSAEIPPRVPIIPGQPVYYRITMVVLEPFIEAFNDRHTREYQDISTNLVRAVDELYEDLEGRQSATVIKIQKRDADVFSSKVTMDLGTVDYYDHGRIRNHLYSHIRNYHTLGPYKVSTEDFTFREFEGGSRLPTCGPDELPCHSGECVPATARCNGRFECRDESDERGCDYNINEVDIRPQFPFETTDRNYDQPNVQTSTGPSIFATIFDNIYNQTSGLEDVSGEDADPTTTTNRPWFLPEPSAPTTEPDYRFRPFDHDSRTEPPTPAVDSTTSNVLVTLFNKLYNDTADLSNESEEEPTTSVYPYPPSPPRPSGRCRADDVVRCADGSAICADQQCDGIRDCPDGDDEWNCSTACAEGELSCDISRCVPLSKRCDGYDDCEDRTDELECGE